MAQGSKILGIAARNAAVFVACLAVAKLSLMLGGFAGFLWAPAGLSLATLLLLGYGIAPGISLAALVFSVWNGAPVFVGLAIAVGNTLEAILGAWALRRLVGFEGAFDRLRHVGGLLIPAAVMSTLVGATIGATSLSAFRVVSAHHFWATWRSWWAGDLLGDIIVAPLLLTWATVRTSKFNSTRFGEAFLLGVVLLGESVAIFWRAPAVHAHAVQHVYVLFIVFIWAALRFEVRGAATATAVVVAFTIYGTAHGSGPFVRDSLAASLLAAQVFVGCAAFTSLVVAGAISDRARAICEEREQARKLRILAEASRAFARSEEPESILNEAARSCAELVGDGCIVEFVTEEPRELQFAAHYDRDPLAREAAARLLVGKRAPRTGTTQRVAETKDHILIPTINPKDVPALFSAAHGEFLDQCPTYSLVAVPLLMGAEVVGVLELSRRSAGRPYTDVDLTLVRDLADRAGLALHNARLCRDLRAAVQLRDDFLAIAGHELKTPLGALLMQIQGLQRAVRRDPLAKVGERLEKAEGSALRMERLINQLLDVSRIAAGRLNLEPEPVDIADVVREVVARFADASAKANSPIAIHGEAHVSGYWDRLRIDQVITNLLSNAVKYGQGKPVEVDLRTEDGNAVVRVADHGIGIDEAQQKKMFQKFERAVAARDFGGFGLGLWIARQIAEASAGSVGVQSTSGQGSVFTVRLPMEEHHAAR